MDKLLENGLELIAESIDLLQGTPGSKDVRNAVIFMSIGIELIVKEGLAAEHWSLVFDDPKKAAKDKWLSGDFYTVGFVVGIERLRKITGKPMTYIEGFDRLREIRNDLEHKGILPDITQMKGAAAEALAAAIKLIADIPDGLADCVEIADASFEPASLRRIKKGLVDFEEFAVRRFREIEPLLANKLLVKCPSCRQNAVTFGGSAGIKCNFCLTQVSLLEHAFKRQAQLCPHCQQMTLLCDFKGPSPFVCCVNCAREWRRVELDQCGKCRNLVMKGKGDCAACMSDLEWVYQADGSTEA